MTWGPQVGGDGLTEEVHLGGVKTYQKQEIVQFGFILHCTLGDMSHCLLWASGDGNWPSKRRVTKQMFVVTKHISHASHHAIDYTTTDDFVVFRIFHHLRIDDDD